MSKTAENSTNLSSRSVLVVTQDQPTRLALGTILKQLKVTQSQFVVDPATAKKWLLTNLADFVIVDLDHSKDAAIYAQELASGTRTPVLAIGSLETIVGFQDREDFLPRLIAKPFNEVDLFEAANLELGGTTGGAEGEDAESGYCKVSLSDFLAGKEAKFDLYIRISKKKFIKIAHKGESPSIDRLRSYKERDVRFLYIPKKDFRTYVGFNLTVLPALTASDRVSQEKKVALVKHVGEILIEKSFVEGVEPELLKDATTYVKTATDVLTDATDAMKLLNSLQNHADFVFAHSVAVSLYAVMIGRQIGWTSPGTHFKLATGGLFHDIGKKEIPRDLLVKDRNEYTPDDVKLYESHAIRGSQILSRIPSMPPDIVQIVMQHHENALGHGFPQGLKRENTHPLARVISVANEFIHFVMPVNGTPMLKPHDAIERLLLAQERLLDPFFFMALMQMFNFPLPQKMKILYERERIKTTWNSGKAS